MAISKEVRDAAFSALTFSAALGAAFVLAGVDGIPPIMPALAASLVVATVEGGLGLRSPYANVEITQENVVRWVLTFIIALGLVAALAVALPHGSRFVCEPLVPWRISIVMFGAFFCAWIAASLKLRAPESRLQWLIPIMLAWIAPFYGFFHAPWFLAQSFVIACPDRPIAQCVIAAMILVLAALAGARAAAWMFEGRRG